MAFRVVKHGLYAVPFFVNPNVAHKTGCTKLDVDLMLRLLKHTYASTRSVVRSMVEVVHAHTLTHKSRAGSVSDFAFIDAFALHLRFFLRFALGLNHSSLGEEQACDRGGNDRALGSALGNLAFLTKTTEWVPLVSEFRHADEKADEPADRPLDRLAAFALAALLVPDERLRPDRTLAPEEYELSGNAPEKALATRHYEKVQNELVEEIDDAVSGTNHRVRACRILHSIRYKYIGTDLLNIEWRVTHGKVGVLERPRRPQQIKAHVVSGDEPSSEIR